MRSAAATVADRRTTARDVAKYAGVSLMTVSRVVNGEPTVRSTTRARVEQAIQLLGFQPNSAAKALAACKVSPKIAFMFDPPNSAALGEMIDHGFEAAAAANVQLAFVKMPAEGDPASVLASLAELGIEGVVLLPPLCDDVRLRILLGDAGIRVVAIGCDDEDPAYSTIGIDDSRAAYELTRYLVRLGHTRIGFARGHPRHQSSEKRRAGHVAALVAHGIEPDPALEWEGASNFSSAIAAAERALDARPPITALLAADDTMAAAAMSAALARGIDVPRMLTVCAFDDSGVASRMFPQLTTVTQPMSEMIRWGVRQLADELRDRRRGEEPATRRELLAHALNFRGSDAPPEYATAANTQARVSMNHGARWR